jgi:hypothetical protein
MRRFAFALLGTAVLSIGCMQQREFMDPTSNLGIENGRSQSNMSMRNGLVRGDFGERRGFDGEATHMDGASDYEFKSSYVNVARQEESRGAGMVIVSTNGKTLEQLEIGRHDFEYNEESLDQDVVLVSVCSGTSVGAIDYDQPADRGHLVVSDNPEGGRRIDVHTETAELDPVTGARLSQTESSDTSFVFVPGGTPQE